MFSEGQPRGTLRVKGKQNPLFPMESVNKFFGILSSSKLWNKLCCMARKNYVLDAAGHKFARVSMCLT